MSDLGDSMLKKYVLWLIFIVAGYSPVFASDYSDLLIKRDELIAQRDEIDSNDYYEALKAILVSAIERKTREMLVRRINTPEHFARKSQNITQQFFDEISALKKEHHEYTFSLDQVVVINISRIEQEDVRQAFLLLSKGSPAAVTTKKILSLPCDDVRLGGAAKIVHNYLQEQWPNQTIAITFHPYFFSKLENLRAALQHELAHLTQPDWQTKLYDNADIHRWMEIDADIKAMCHKNSQGEWRLDDNYKDTIHNLYEVINHDELQSDAINDLCCDLNENEHKRMADDLKWLCIMIQLNSLHPPAQFRKAIMLRIATLIKQVGTITDSEMEAMTTCITRWYYIKANQELGDAFLNKAQEAEKILVSNPKFECAFDAATGSREAPKKAL